MPIPTLPVIGANLDQWGRQLTQYLSLNLSKLGFKTVDDNPSANGIILWDEVNGYPVVSKNNEFVQIVLEDGHASFYRTSDVIIDTGAGQTVNTAYAITYDAPTGNVGIDRDDTDNSKIVFEQAGQYLLMFSAQISSTSSSTVKFYFWPRLNGADAPNNTVIYALHQNDATQVVSRSAKFDVSAGDYLQVMWAVDGTSGYLDASAATAFSPAAPATTLHITRLHG
jgi:hypothetical protein